METHFWLNFEILYLREYFIEFNKIASPNILVVDGPHHVAKNVGNTFYRKYWQQFQILRISVFWNPKFLILKMLPEFRIEIVADIFGNMMGTL